MIFNSIEFLFFFPLVVVLYWLFKGSLKWQNLLILAASYFFYGWWDWRFLSLIVFSTFCDYIIGIEMHKSFKPRKKKQLLALSISLNLGLLAFFKYHNFFIENFVEAFTLLGGNIEISSLNIILPVGISFYTFQTMSYTIDIYRGQLKPTGDFISFAAFVSFFPQLVAGPIERASNLLPQFYTKRHMTYETCVSGLNDVLWGLFMKIVIADRLAIIVNEVYNSPFEYHGFILVFATILFAFQIYCDFAGYSKIAIGTAKMMGFTLMKNFNTPYFSKSLSEFWSRWHISLSTWFRDYLYIPLGGNRVSRIRWAINLLIVFVLSGFWHGAEWTFIIWGLIHGVFLIIESNIKFNFLPRLQTIINPIFIFGIVCFGWIFFRSNSLNDAIYIIKELFVLENYSISDISFNMIPVIKNTVYPIDVFLSVFLVLFLLTFEKLYSLKFEFTRLPFLIRSAIYTTGVWMIFIVGAFEKNEFIYFQF